MTMMRVAHATRMGSSRNGHCHRDQIPSDGEQQQEPGSQAMHDFCESNPSEPQLQRKMVTA